MASTWGKVLDQASIMLSRQDLEKACIKATRHDNMIPKEKHVRRLVLCTHERSDLLDKVYVHLAERLEIPDWIVVLKTLEVYHRLFREGNPRFLAELKWKGTIFPLSKFNDPTSAEAHAQSVFIRKYAQYLEEKVLVYRALRMEFERDPALLKGLSVEESFVRLPKLQRQLDALIHCQTSAEAIANPITALAFEMLLKDSFKLYRGLNDGIITLLESYFTMDKTFAITALEIYRTFMRETSSIIAMYEMAKKKFTLELPDLKHAPTTLVNSLEDYIRGEDDPDHSSNRRHSNDTVPQKSPHKNDNGYTQPSQSHNPTTASLIDPFGVTELVNQPASQYQNQPGSYYQSQPPQNQATNLFDPFGDSLPPSHQSPSHFSTQPTQAYSSTSSFSIDPFAGNTVALQPQTQAQSTYAEKAQQIKAAYTPTLQPTSPSLSPHQTPNAYMNPSYNSGLQPTQNSAFQYPPQYTAPAGYAAPYQSPTHLSPQMSAQQQHQQPTNPFL